MREIRQSIFENRFLELYHEKRAFLHESCADHPIHKQKPRRKKMEFHLGNYEVHFAPQGFASIRQISPARSCTRARRRWRRRSGSTSISPASPRACAFPRRKMQAPQRRS